MYRNAAIHDKHCAIVYRPKINIIKQMSTRESFFKKVSLRTGLSIIEVINVFVHSAAVVRHDLATKGACLVPYLGRYRVVDCKRRKQKIMDFKTKQQIIVSVAPRKQVKFECSQTIKSISNFNMSVIKPVNRPVKPTNGPIEISS